MQNNGAFLKFVTLGNGKEVLIRLLNGEDRTNLIKFFQQTPLEDAQFCKQELNNPLVIDSLLNQGNCHRPLTLVAVDLPTNRIVASLSLSKGQQAALNVGDIQQFIVSRAFQGLGLGSMILNCLIELAGKENLHWLKVEIVTEMKNIIKAFQSKGFETRAILDDYFIDSKGATYDVALMLRPLINLNYDEF